MKQMVFTNSPSLIQVYIYAETLIKVTKSNGEIENITKPDGQMVPLDGQSMDT